MRVDRRQGRGASVLMGAILCLGLLALIASTALASLGSGAVSAWGDNTYGQLGDGYEGWEYDSKVPVAVSGLSGAKSVAASGSAGLALMQDGTVMGWGNNGAGELGDGTITQRDTPVALSGLSGVKQIAAGSQDGYALLDNGTVEAWGYDNLDQLGPINPTEICESGAACIRTPTPVPGLTGVKAIAAGESYVLALLDNGTVEAWGEGSWGQLGSGPIIGLEICPEEPAVEGSRLCSKTPVAVSGLSTVTGISAGHGDSLALLEGGTVKSWGYNGAGQLGAGSTEGPEWCVNRAPCSGVPVALSGLSGVTQVSAGDLHNLALLSDGTVEAWGNDEAGQLGDGGFRESDVPVAVKGLAGVTQISAGNYHSLALLSDGTVEAWGEDELWQLGNIETEGLSRVPVPVSGLSGVTAIAAGNGQSYAVGGSAVAYPQIANLNPHHGAQAGGTSVTITGLNFTGATAVDFGSKSAASFTVNSSSSITAVSPPGTGEVDVTVSTPEGTSYTSPRDDYCYGIETTGERPLCEGEATPGGGKPAEEPVVSGEAASNVTEDAARITAGVNPRGTTEITYFVQYGTTTSYGMSAPNPPATIQWFTCGLECAGEEHTPRPVSVNLTELQPGTTYHYRVVASDGGGEEHYGEDSTFTTQSEPSSSGGETRPSIDSESVSNITERDATLEAQIDPNGRYSGYEFQIDTTGRFDFSGPVCPFSFPGDAECDAILASGERMPGGVEPKPQYLAAGTSAETVSLDLASIGVVLAPGTTYHYRVIATSGGPVVDGPDQTFATGESAVVHPLGQPQPPSETVPSSGQTSGASQSPSTSTSVTAPLASTLADGSTTSGTPKLSRALAACRHRSRSRRAVCARRARNLYARASKSRKG